MSDDGLNREEVLAKVRGHLSTELEVPLDEIEEATRFRDDLDADSLDLYELVMELEDTYGVSVSEEEAAHGSRRSARRSTSSPSGSARPS